MGDRSDRSPTDAANSNALPVRVIGERVVVATALRAVRNQRISFKVGHLLANVSRVKGSKVFKMEQAVSSYILPARALAN